MKKFSKLIPAFCMLLISAMLMGTSTFAWFSMNTQVKATGMQIKAKTDATYLVISDSSTLGSNKELNMNVSGELLPTSYTTTEIQNSASNKTLVNANKWFTAIGEATNNGTAKTDSKKELTITNTDNKFGTADNKNYYVYSTFYIGLASGSSAVLPGKGIQADVTFNSSKESELNKTLTVKIVYGDGDIDADTKTQTFVYDAASGEVIKHSTALQADDLITSNATKVTVYAYFDGEHTSCKTENAINLDNIDVIISFTVNDNLHS